MSDRTVTEGTEAESEGSDTQVGVQSRAQCAVQLLGWL